MLDTEVGANTVDLICLEACVNELSGGLASTITCYSEEPREVIATSLDALLDKLRLDFGYATFVDPDTRTSCVVARTAHTREPAIVRQRIGPAIEVYLSDQSQAPCVAMRSGAGDAQVVRLRLGLHDEVAIMLLGSTRKDFPTLTERLLLSVAANLVAIKLWGSHLLRVSQELDRKVRQQARELQRANEELQRVLERSNKLQGSLRRNGDMVREHAAWSRGGLAAWQMQRAARLMTANFQEHVPLAWLAEQCGLSMRHFARAFRQSTGVPPHRWLLNRRIEHAKELLRNPTMSLVEVALACGFADQSHFTRTFTAVVRVGPGLWRRMQSWRLPVDGARTESPLITNGMPA